jgi:hypothetical protein
MDDKEKQYVALCKEEVLKGGDCATRIKQAPLYIELSLSHDEENLDAIIETVRSKLDINVRLDNAIDNGWNNLLRERANLQQCGSYMPLLDDPEAELQRIYTFLHFYHPDIFKEYKSEWVMERVKTRIYPRIMGEKVRRDTDWTHQDVTYQLECVIDSRLLFEESMEYEEVLKDISPALIDKFLLLCGGEIALRKLMEDVRCQRLKKFTKGSGQKPQT